MIYKYQYGAPVYVPDLKTLKATRRLIGRGTKKVAEYGLKGLGWLGEALNNVVTAGASSDFGQTSPFTFSTGQERRNILKGRERVRLQAKLKIDQGMTWVSPLNYGAALWNGHGLNAEKGAEEISTWDPRWQLLGRVGELYVGPKAVKGVKATPRAVINTAAKAGNKTARAYLISKEIGKGKINLKELSNLFIEPYVTNPKGSGKVIHYDNGDAKSVFRNSGASIRDGKLVPGQTTRNLSNFTWWNKDNPYLNVHKSQGRFSPSRYITVDLTNLFVHPLKAGKSVGLSDGAGRGFILPTEVVSEIPVDLSNASIILRSPFGWWEKVKVQPSKSSKLLRVVSEGTYPIYRGKQYSVREVVNPDGTVNPRQAMRILHEVSEQFPGSYKMEHRLENPEWHQNDPTTYQHTRNVALSAWRLPTPEGFTKQDQMIAALGHDFGKMISGDGHAQIGADLARQIFPDLTDALYTAIAEHMGTPTTTLGLITKAADITNGRPFTYLQQYAPGLYNQYLGNTLRVRSRLVTNGDDFWELNIKDWYDERVQSIPDEIKKNLKEEDISLGLDDLFYKNGFTPKHKVNQGKFNEAFGVETVRRLQGFGIKPLSYISVYDGPLRTVHTVQGKVTQNAKTPSYMGYFLQEGTPGFYSPFWDVSVVDPTLRISVPDITFHERNMHGSESVLEAAADIPRSVNDMSPEVLLNYGPGATPMKPYILFVNNLVYKKGSSDLLPEIEPLGDSFKYKHHLFADGALDWKEARATIGQVIRNLYMKARKGKSYTSINDIRPEFEKIVDNISDSELGELLYNANDYGKTYLQVGPKVNPNFYKELRALLKYAPGISPFIFGNNEKE